MEKLPWLLVGLLFIAGWNQSFKERWGHLTGREPSTEQQAAEPAEAPVANHSEALLIVGGKTGGGSGFLCRMDGHTVIVTNAHVVAGIPGFTLTSLTGTAFTVQGGAVAVGHDLVKMEIAGGTGAGKGLEVMENLDAKVKVGDAVVVLGNAEGAKVVRPVEGKVVGIGPNLVEVDAPFVPGNSGSPIIHKASGKVLGVATYLLKRKVNKDSTECVTTEARRFGYRLDHVSAWEPINWQAFYAQASQVEKIEQLSKDFITLFQRLGRGGNGGVGGDYKSPAILRAIQLLSAKNMRSLGSEDRADVIPRFLGDLRFASRGDVQSFDKVHSYDYFRQIVDEHTRLRDEIYAALNRVLSGVH